MDLMVDCSGAVGDVIRVTKPLFNGEPPLVLSLDLGTQMGFAHNLSGKVKSGSMNLNPSAYDCKYLRFKNMYDFLNGLSKKPHMITFEQVRAHKGVEAAHIYGGFYAILGLYCEENEVTFKGVPVQTIKKFATGKGNATKQDMIKYCLTKNHSVVDDNEADALALYYYTINEVL